MELLEQIKSISSTRRDLRNFGLTVGIVLLLIAAVLWYYDRSTYLPLGIIGGALVLLGLILPKVLLPLQKAWMALAVTLGWIVTRIILLFLFYVVFTLVRLIGLLFGKRYLELKWDRSAASYWNVREHTEFDKAKAERQF